MRFKLMSVAMGDGVDNIWTLDSNHRVWIYGKRDGLMTLMPVPNKFQ